MRKKMPMPGARQPNAKLPIKMRREVLSDTTLRLRRAQRDESDGQKTPAQYVSHLKG
jgi:hypothetical protein